MTIRCDMCGGDIPADPSRQTGCSSIALPFADHRHARALSFCAECMKAVYDFLESRGVRLREAPRVNPDGAPAV